MIAAVCHDFDHDGLNNTYHVNAFTQRTVRYHHKSVQETYHAAQSFEILNNPKFNFLC